MARLALFWLMVLCGCAVTRGPAPGAAVGDELVVTYYYLNF